MKIKEVKAKLYEWKGPIITTETKFNNPLSALPFQEDSQAPFRFFSWLVVEITTEDGIVGYGNAGLSPDLTKMIIDKKLAGSLIGENALNTDYLYEKMMRSSVAYGRKGAVMAAISAIDIALWDIKGKAFKQPVYNLLGGRTKEAIPAYYSRLYTRNLEDLAQEAQEAKDAGFQAMKMRLGHPITDGAKGLEKNLEMIKTVRDVVGSDIDIMIEAYMSLDYNYARKFLKKVEQYDPRWVEEMLMPDEMHLQGELKKMTDIPISGGEHAFGKTEFADIIRNKQLDIIQFDTNRVGGITEAQKICHLAEVSGVEVIPHGGQMHNLHIVMSSFAAPMAEYFPKSGIEVGNELFWYVFNGDRDAENGLIQLDDNLPGIGLELNQEDMHNFNIIE